MKRAVVLAAAMMALLCSAAPINADTDSGAGFSAAFTLSGLQNFEAALVAFVNNEFQNLTLPDMHLEPSIPIIGKVKIDLTDIKITGFHIPGATFSLTAPDVVGAGVTGTGLTVTMAFHYRENNWPHISDHGTLEAVPKQGNIGAAAAVTVVNGLPHFTATSTSADFDKIDIKFHGGASWLYNFIADLFSSTIRHDVDDAIAKALTGIVNTNLNAAIAKLPTHVSFGGGHDREDLDLSTLAIAVNTTDSTPFLSIDNVFSITDNETQALCPLLPVALPALDPQTHQLQFFLASSVLNCMIWVPFTNGAMEFAIPSSVMFWAEFIPQLQKLFPGLNMTSAITPAAQPTVTIDTGGVTGTMTFAVNQSVFTGPNGEETWADTLSFEFNFELDLWVAASKKTPSTNSLYGQVTALTLNVSVINTGVGPIDLTDLQLIINVAEPIVTAAINGILGDGLPLPLIPGITLVNPQILFGSGYFGVATDFQFGAVEPADEEEDQQL